MAINSITTRLQSQDGGSYKKTGIIGGDFATALTAAREELPKCNTDAQTYVVRSSDSLYRISQRLKTSLALPQSVTTLVRKMTSLNNLADPDRIFPGQVLRLPVSAIPNRPQIIPPSGMQSPLLQQQNSAASSVQIQGNANIGPPAAAVSNVDFPLFAQRGNIILPSIIPTSYFTRQNVPTTNHSLIETPNIETVAEVTEQPAEPPALLPVGPLAPPQHGLETQIAMYKEDQLLAHPGGDDYFLNRTENIHDPSFDQATFLNRVGKDLSDAGENLLNVAKNLAMGSQFKYVGENGEINSGQRVGLLGTLKNFVEDVFSGLSFGAYVPDNEIAPEGAAASVGHFIKKIFYDAPIKDLLIGVPHAAVNIVKDSALASLNLLEVIPDATIGNFEWGQKATTAVFDNGQVMVDYLTDVLPGGDAWLRVHAAGPQGDIKSPVYFNLMTSEKGITDSRWSTVRNTPFRKTIETIGSLLSDAALVAITAHSYSPSSDQRHN
jgi:LysM repeat protein